MISFKSTRIIRTGHGELGVAGDLTIRGVTRNVVFTVEGPTPPARDPWENTRVGLSATTKINRKDFGLTPRWRPVAFSSATRRPSRSRSSS